MTVIKYNGVEHVKDYFISSIAPKYFNMDEINDLNVGLLGYTTEVGANTTEDTFNALSMYVKEAFPSMAQLPESLYNYAAILDIGELFASPSQVQILLLIKEKDIIEKGTKDSSMINFILDRQIVVDVDGIPFSPDYNITITAKPYRGDHVFTAQYDMTYINSISTESIPYLKTIRIPVNNESYLGIMVPKAHQVSTKIQDEVIIDNDVINNTTISVEFNDQLAGFDILYKAPNDKAYTTLTKKVYGGTPLKTPFCFYKLKGDGGYQITFTMMDGYFQPEFNADIRIITYTTIGEGGNFSEYKGSNITAAPFSSEYDYNNNVIIMAMPQGSSVNGQSAISMEDLRSVIVSKWATSGAYNNENDLQLYIENHAKRNDTNVFFVKKRDDLIERLFSAFSLFKNVLGDYYPSNTLYLKLFEEDFDRSFAQDGRSIINAGATFKYDGDSKTTVVRVKDAPVGGKLGHGEFSFTNPFVLSVQKAPTIVGYYLNSVNSKISLDYTHVNINSYYQFISNTISIKRDSLRGENSYKLSGTFVPATPLPPELTTVPEGSPEGTLPAVFDKMKILVSINDNGTDTCYREMTIVNFDEVSGILTVECLLDTDDTITQDEKIKLTNVLDVDDNSDISKMVPMIDCVLNFYTLFKYDEAHEHDKSIFKIQGYDEYTLTNRYSTTSEPIDFMVPMNIIRSKCKYMPFTKDDGEGGTIDSYYYLVDLVPLLKFDAISSDERFEEFISSLHTLYSNLYAILDNITTNYNIDLNFYNTYGRSSNFVVGVNEEPLDRVNMSIEFKVTPRLGVIVDDLIPKLKAFIKEYIENANNLVDSSIANKGYNAIYISNLMRMIENQFADEVDHHQFVRINEYDSSIQVVENKTVDMSTLTQEERRSYVPEYLTIDLNDIKIELVYK